MRKANRTVRKQKIAQAALAEFMRNGYQSTQVSDIARAAGVAAGTIYLFSKGKEELFWMALRAALGRDVELDEAKEMTADELRQELSSGESANRLRMILDQGLPMPTLPEVLDLYWSRISGSAQAIQLVERCSRSWPQLAEAFYHDYRAKAVQDLADYLVAADRARLCRPVPNPHLAARLMIETMAWMTMHRLGDPDGKYIPPDDARSTTIDAFTHAFQREKS